MRHNTQIMAKTSQNGDIAIRIQTLPKEWFNMCYPQVCTQIENRYLIKIYDDVES